MGGFAGVHQFCRICAHAFIVMGALVNGDVPPYLLVASDDYGRPSGINSEGLKRRGLDGDCIAAIKRAYRAVYVADGSLADARKRSEEPTSELQSLMRQQSAVFCWNRKT